MCLAGRGGSELDQSRFVQEHKKNQPCFRRDHAVDPNPRCPTNARRVPFVAHHHRARRNMSSFARSCKVTPDSHWQYDGDSDTYRADRGSNWHQDRYGGGHGLLSPQNRNIENSVRCWWNAGATSVLRIPSVRRILVMSGRAARCTNRSYQRSEVTIYRKWSSHRDGLEFLATTHAAILP